MFGQNDPSFWLPPRVSTAGETTDTLFYFIFYLSLFFFALIVALMLWFVIKYLRREGRRPEKGASHNLPLEVTWTAIPLILVIIIFYIGFTGFVRLRTAPTNAMKINVYAQKWSWEFEYPNGHRDAELHVPVNEDVVLTLQSLDVIHSLYIPAFRVKMDVVPGRFTKMWFRPTHAGDYTIFCTEYCGTGHSDMIATCVVHEPGEYEVWLENADPLKRMLPEQYEEYIADPAAFLEANPEFEGLEGPVEMGRKLYAKKGCAQCHSVDGSGGTGPTFKGIFGASHQMTDGTSVTVDENYLRESILEPQAKVVAGYEPVMPTYSGRLSDREITALIAYIESLAGES